MPDDTGGIVQLGVCSWFGRFLPKRGNGVQDPRTGGVEGGEKTEERTVGWKEHRECAVFTWFQPGFSQQEEIQGIRSKKVI